MSGIEFRHTVLDNGLTVIAEINPRAASAAAGYMVRTGSRDESAEVAGVSHFLEHMMFKGTARRSAEDINREFDEMGANYNAFTNEEQTVYYGAVVDNQLPALLDLLSDMMRPTLNQADFDMEKKVILEEIAMYQDHPDFRAFDLLSPLFHAGHPLGNSVLGSIESITALTRDQMHQYHAGRYAPDNITLVMTGNLDWDACVAQVTGLTRDWQPAGAARDLPELNPASGHEVVTDGRLKRSHLALQFAGLSATDPFRPAAELLITVLGGSSNSRLYWALVDRGLADSAVMGMDVNEGAGSVIAYASSDPGRASQTLDTILQVLRDAQDNPPTEEEWTAATNKSVTGLTLRSETPYGRLMTLGTNWLDFGRYMSLEDEVARLRGASLADARQLLARRPFDSPYILQLGPGQ